MKTVFFFFLVFGFGKGMKTTNRLSFLFEGLVHELSSTGFGNMFSFHRIFLNVNWVTTWDGTAPGMRKPP